MIVDVNAPGSGACKPSAAVEISSNHNLEVFRIKGDRQDDDGITVVDTAVDFKPVSVNFPVWYNPDSITSVERDYLHSLLTHPIYNSDNYLQIRNFIIRLYELCPSIYLSATDCRRKIAGDVCSMVKIHEFLDSFGIINHSVLPETKPRQVAEISYLWTDICRPVTEYSRQNTDRDFATSIDENDFMRVVVGRNFNWGDIAVAYHTLLAGSSVSSVTAEMCFSRFLRIELDKCSLQSLNNVKDGISLLNLDDSLFSNGGIEATAAVLRLVARGLAGEAATARSKGVLLDRSRQTLLSSLASSPRISGEDSLELRIVRVASTARLALEKLAERVEGILDDYICLRRHALEEKVTLLYQTEESLRLDDLRATSAKRDIEVDKARFAVGLKRKVSRSVID